MMKISRVCLVALCAPLVSGFTAGGPAFHRSAEKKSTGTTTLFISSWGSGGPGYRNQDTLELDPENNVEDYLENPSAVEARNNVDGNCLVSGLVKSKERSDQTIFDFLNDEESAFQFDKIIAFVDDEKYAKKRLLSRSARYTGLLDKLDFRQAASAGELPTVEQLDGIKSWVAVVENDGDDALDTVSKIAALAKEASSVENIAILLTNGVGLDTTKSQEVLEALKGDDSLSYTLVVVGKIEDHDEGKIPYKYMDFGSEDGVLEGEAIYSRDESLRLITELLQLECGVNKALTFQELYEETEPEFRLIKGLRKAGYVRMQEIDHMVKDGPEVYTNFVEQWKEKNPDSGKGYTTDAWWESEKFLKQIKRRVDQPSGPSSDDEVKKEEEKVEE